MDGGEYEEHPYAFLIDKILHDTNTVEIIASADAALDTTHNAITLLEAIGFPSDVISEARRIASAIERPVV